MADGFKNILHIDITNLQNLMLSFTLTVYKNKYTKSASRKKNRGFVVSEFVKLLIITYPGLITLKKNLTREIKSLWKLEMSEFGQFSVKFNR